MLDIDLDQLLLHVTALSQNPKLIDALTVEQQQELIRRMEGMLKDEDGWPKVFIHRTKQKVYKPHTVQEAALVYGDEPRYGALLGGEGSGKSTAGIVKDLGRVRRKMSGLMCCVAPETIVEGMPIAEHVNPFMVQTLWGPALSSPAFLEGQADLFRVETESGESVTVAENHRFLTPAGWRRLVDLRVGSVIAVDGNWRARSCCEKLPGSLGCCLRDPHPCGELSTCEEEPSRGTHTRPSWSELGNVEAAGFHDRVYTDSCFLQRSMASSCDLVSLAPSSACRIAPARSGASRKSALWEGNCCSPQRLHRRSSLRNLDSASLGQSVHACLGYGTLTPCLSRPETQFREDTALHQTARLSCSQSLYPYQDYTTEVRWVSISSISFSRHGEYWDIAVPGPQHYVAQGIISHNSPNLPHFQRSLWKEFQQWCPWDLVIPAHRNRGDLSWMPMKPSDIVFENGAYIHCVGVQNAGSLEGPNLSWLHFDEARHYPDKTAITTTDGRVRIEGTLGEPPQMWYTTTPRLNWLFDYFGPADVTCLDCSTEHHGETGIAVQTGGSMICPTCGSTNLQIDDDLFSFKMNSLVVHLTTQMNEENTMDGFAEARSQTLTEAEIAVLVEGKWGDIEQGQPFLPSILWWDQCREDLPLLGPRDPIVISLDAATGREIGDSDCFAIAGMSRHPDRPDDAVAIRFTKTWQVGAGEKLDYVGTEENPGPERFLAKLCGWDIDHEGRFVPNDSPAYNVIMVVYDPRELHDMSQRMMRAGIASFREFGQVSEREEADRQFLSLITHKRIAHNGNQELRRHIQMADRKLDSTGKKLRLAKRSKSSRIDLAVVASMGSFECLRLNL